MDQIRLCDIGRRNIEPTVSSVDRVLENSSEVGERPIILYTNLVKKRRMGFMYIVTGFRPSPLFLALQVTTTTILHLLPVSSLLSSLTPLLLVP